MRFWSRSVFNGMKFNQVEIIGIAICIGILVVALWFVRVDQTSSLLINDEAGTVMVDDSENQAAAAATALESAFSGGKLQKLVIDDVVYGVGDEVQEGDTVTVHYTGSLPNGQQFDNSYQTGEPFSFKVGAGKVIEGWEEGILGMKVGGERILVIPPSKGYGSRDVGPIPGGSNLVFTIELLSIE